VEITKIPAIHNITNTPIVLTIENRSCLTGFMSLKTTTTLKYPWSNGVVEGHVNRLKKKKREMYGRAGFELLRRKVVLSNSG
jgi:hypothetical protein